MSVIAGRKLGCSWMHIADMASAWYRPLIGYCPSRSRSAIRWNFLRSLNNGFACRYSNTKQKNILLGSIPSGVDSPPASHDLQKHHTETVNIRFERELTGHRVIGRAISVSAHHSRRNMGFVTQWAHLSKPKIRQLGEILLSKQNV
ncbi:tRNA (guanine(37)-N1)-methyltransferase [Striga asiatica]|uniref:tRNA (Guanine(37)-N1)-methyltransferase n=1 Tax=Striga asiatica TaxID=4170 RepID=A0A5A7NZE0_STRAF|nr:tRNA (guanine(37)-N1)-methyltransferase [Striga asiatica]